MTGISTLFAAISSLDLTEFGKNDILHKLFIRQNTLISVLRLLIYFQVCLIMNSGMPILGCKATDKRRK